MPRRPQKSLARNASFPLKRVHYRQTCRTPKLQVEYPPHWRNAIEQLGSPRTAARVFIRKTKRWFGRGDEEIVIAFKNLEGEFIAELTHQVRRPSNHEPLYTKQELQADGTRKTVRKRKADLYHQHTPALLYNFNDSTHARAFCELLQYSTAFVAGCDHPGRYPYLYRMEIGETKELGRWPINGLYYQKGQTEKLVPAVHGFEILEAVCGPGERPRKPYTLCGERPDDAAGAKHYDEVAEHWRKQLEGCHSTQTILRLRRISVDDNGHIEPAFYLRAIYEFDLPFPAIRRLATDFPAFWNDLYKQYYIQANAAPRALRTAKLRGTRRNIHKWKHESSPEYLTGPVWAHRQPRWNYDVVHDWLYPEDVEELCRLVPQPGLFVCTWVSDVKRYSPEYFQRVALFQAGAITWNPKWSATAEDVELDTFRLRLQYTHKISRLVYVFLLFASLKTIARKQGQVHHRGSEKFLHDVVRLYGACLARAPPILIDNHGGW